MARDEPGPGHPDPGPRTPAPQMSEEDRRELWEPEDLFITEEQEYQMLRHAKFLIVVDQARGTGQPPSLNELLDNIAARTRNPEPDTDWEAEP